MNRNSILKNEGLMSVRTIFFDGKMHTKNELSERTGISLAGTTNILQELRGNGEILYDSDASSTGGRRSKQYILNAEYAHIGMIICRRIKNEYLYETRSFNLAGQEITGTICPSKSGSPDDFEDAVRSLFLEDPLIRALSVSIPGVSVNGIVQFCDFEQLEGRDLSQILGQDGTWIVENDVNVACIGFAHTHSSCKNLALIYQPSAMYSGSGILINGRLYNGAFHMAGEMQFLPGAKPVGEAEDPAGSLWTEIRTLQAVLDPEIIAWKSDLTEEKDLMKYAAQCERPVRLVHVEDLEGLIRDGLYRIGMERLLKSIGGRCLS